MLDDEELDYHYNNAYYSWKYGEYDEAIKSCDKYLAYDSTNEQIRAVKADTLHSLGDLASRRGQYSKALSFYEQALRINPRHQKVIDNIRIMKTNRGCFFAKKNNHRKALTYFNQVLRQYPHDLSALRYKGTSHFELKEYAQAVACLEKLDGIPLHERAKIDAMLAEAKAALSKHEESSCGLTRVTSSSDTVSAPHTPVVNPAEEEDKKQKLFEAGVMQLAERKFDQALSTFRKVLQIDRFYKPALQSVRTLLEHQAITHLQAKNYLLALQCFSEVAHHFPDDQKAVKNLTQAIIMRAKYFMESGRYENAHLDLLQVLNYNPDHPEAMKLKEANITRLVSHGVYYAKKHDYVVALKLLSKALELEPTHPLAREDTLTVLERRDQFIQMQLSAASQLVDRKDYKAAVDRYDVVLCCVRILPIRWLLLAKNTLKKV
ncbi:MAG TPA: tetratricopeptide repeat protein [Gammaproteobacteria bacterium]|nr:tetratricopeptide repeat protein [Gammaproteobacteria bacterium]